MLGWVLGWLGLADKVKILQQTYSTNNTNNTNNTNTNIERIALVGCGTDGINQNLTQDFVSNISPARLDSSVCWVTIFKSSFH
jgi:hypothetical protein